MLAFLVPLCEIMLCEETLAAGRLGSELTDSLTVNESLLVNSALASVHVTLSAGQTVPPPNTHTHTKPGSEYKMLLWQDRRMKANDKGLSASKAPDFCK